MKRGLGLQSHEVLGHSWLDVAPGLSREEAVRLWQTVIENHTPIRVPEVYYTFPEGQKTVWDRTMTPIMDIEQPDKIRFVLISAVEITEQVQARQELEQLDRLKDDFLSFATHELRTPLTSILGNAQILRNTLRRQTNSANAEEVQPLDLDQGITLLDRIIRQVKQMNKLIEEMLDATRMRSNMFALEYSGCIWLESKPEKGTTFYLSLPLKKSIPS